jgi:hypothetical protein
VASACDVAPFVIKRPEGVATSGRGRGRAVASAASDGFTIAKGTRLRALAFHGQNAPPKVTLHGPGGRLLTTPAGSGGVHNGLGFLFQDFARKTTYVVLIRPAAGHWSIDAPDTVTTEQADGLAPVTIRAKVSGRGSRRVLRWSTKGLRGQRLEFAERSGRAGHKLLATGRAHGSIRFRPDRRLGRRRTIEVTVLNHGLPRLTRVVARYALPRLPRLRAISGLRLRRGLLRWRGQPAAVTYALIAVTRRGDHIPATTRRARYRPPRGTLSLTIVAVDIDGRPGPRRSFKLRR